MLFKRVFEMGGNPGNTIITGDFNMDVPPYIIPSTMAVSVVPLYEGLKQTKSRDIKEATEPKIIGLVANQYYIDHVYSNIYDFSLFGENNSCETKSFTESTTVKIGHDSIYCELFIDE